MRRLFHTALLVFTSLSLAFIAAAQEKASPQADSQKADSQKADSQKADSQKADSQKTDSGKKDSPKRDSPKAVEPAADATREASVWMRKKLDYSQQILEGIAEADFERIATNAQAMRALGKVEGFVRGRTPGYRSQLQIFQDATDQLIKHAEKDNVDGAALAFTQLTISCVNCHKHLREVK
jgi:cytoskeletal protein RodZ